MEDLDFDITAEHLMQLDNIEISLLNNSFIMPSSDDECSDIIQPLRRKCRRIILSTSEDSDAENVPPCPSNNTSPSNIWTEVQGNQRRIIPFTDISGPAPHIKCMHGMTPAQCFSLFLTDNILQLIVDATNEYAIKEITQLPEASKFARVRRWTPTNPAELKCFFGLILFMGLVRLPKLADYWCKDDMISHPFPKTIMSRNRFELLLQMLHFSENDNEHKSDRLHRVRKLYDEVNKVFQENFSPTENLCIDESMVPFRGRIIFRQYNKQKRHKYGIKEFKLCTIPGYTYKVKVYAGKNDDVHNTPTNVVMSLCEDRFERGHTLFTDNWYTSITLARQLLQREMHLVGTVRKNRKGLPKEVIDAKLKRGEYKAAESNDGITCLKWKDKRDVYVLSTKHTDRFVNIQQRGKTIRKPKIIVDYNMAKGAVDLSDQLASYSTPLRKSVKWYKKLAINLLLNTTVINALILYQSVTKKTIQIVDFRKEIVQQFCQTESEEYRLREVPKRLKHQLSKKDGKSKSTRRLCSGCYKQNVILMGRQYARNKTKKVNTFCETCPCKPFMCFDCFNRLHKV